MTIRCQHCKVDQKYNGQANCENEKCGKRLNNWSVAGQVRIQKEKEKNNDSEDDAA